MLTVWQTPRWWYALRESIQKLTQDSETSFRTGPISFHVIQGFCQPWISPLLPVSSAMALEAALIPCLGSHIYNVDYSILALRVSTELFSVYLFLSKSVVWVVSMWQLWQMLRESELHARSLQVWLGKTYPQLWAFYWKKQVTGSWDLRIGGIDMSLWEEFGDLGDLGCKGKSWKRQKGHQPATACKVEAPGPLFSF